ncbi:MFS transporter [Ferrimonas sp. SCSIO 43195]|uniref:MFS transporter n=1 Tax=Ferrimonas sp. SCSIO 43195 TaxID=2822844 RepID=UPI0020752F58|nr:MFS transporter [Ferrimonas sp. SCSIO 43195]USD37671.1 MFS transporter [Ferrimonas sp. SCSIO 43195]
MAALAFNVAASMPQSVPTRVLILFGLVNLPLSMIMSPTAAILPNFYIEFSAVTLGAMATVTLVTRFFDGITDPLIGLVADRFGSRKPLMMVGALVSALAVWQLFTPAADSGIGYLMSWYLLLALGWTLVEIPHSAISAELSHDYQQRNRISLWRQILGFAGGVLFMAFPLLLGRGRSFDPEVMRMLAGFVAVSLPLLVLLMNWRLTIPPQPHCRRVRLWDLPAMLVTLPYLKHLLLTQILFGLATGAVSGLFVLYASQYLELGDAIPKIALPMTLAMALSMPLWLLVLRRMDKHKLWAVSALGMIGVLLLIIRIEPGPQALTAMIMAMTAFGSLVGLSALVLPSMLGDLVDVDIVYNGKARAGILFAFQALILKINQGVGGAIGMFIPAWFGFNAEQALSAEAIKGLKLGFAGWPCLLLLPMVLLAWRYPLDRRAHAKLASRIAEGGISVSDEQR